MPRFSYIARSASGERVQGALDANDRRSAVLQVERMGLVPVSLAEGVSGASAAPKDKARPAPAAKPVAKPVAKPGGRAEAAPPPASAESARAASTAEAAKVREARMGIRDVLLFSRELSDLIQSGMTLGNALNTLSKRTMRKGQERIIAGLRDEIIKGASLSDALALWPRTFTNLYVNMVRAGEASGQLSEALGRLCKHYERVQEAHEKVLGALTYPAIVLGAGIVTMIFTMLVVIPKFASVFADIGGTLPLPTRILLGASTVLLKYGWAIAIAIFFGVVAFRRYIRTPAGQLKWDGFTLRMPVLKHIVSANAFAQFARTLGALLQNGVPVLQALSIVEDTVGNAVIAREIREARDRVTDGSSISGPLAAGKVFPPLLTDMLAVGEQAGDMTGSLNNIARRYDSDLDRAVKIFTTVLEPILILLVAVLVGFVAVSLLLAVFEMTSALKM
jgi:type II secretory pathway component PulF